MFIYNKKVIQEPPVPKSNNKFKVSIEDVLLTFQSYEIRGSRVYIIYSISYFNIPQNVREYDINKNVDFDSLRKAINETIPDLGKFITIESLNSKQVKLVFDAKKFITHASYPAKIVNQRKIYETVLKLNQPLPALIKQIDAGDISSLLSSIMTTEIRNDKKYRHIFSHMNSWSYSKNTTVEAKYNIEKNEFFVNIRDPFKLIYYYL